MPKSPVSHCLGWDLTLHGTEDTQFQGPRDIAQSNCVLYHNKAFVKR